MDFESLPIFGSPFEHVETYVYYQGRRTFSMRSKALGFYVFVNTVDEDEEEESLTTLVAITSTARFWALRTGQAPFREAFTSALTGHVVVWKAGDEGGQQVAHISPFPDELPEHWLPTDDARLSMPESDVAAYSDSEVQRISTEQHRSVVALKVASSGNVTQFPARAAGELQIAFDGEFRSLVRKHSNPQIARELVPVVVGLRAASFVILMAVESSNAIVEDPAATSAFEDLRRLVDAVGLEPAHFLEVLASHESVVRNHFMEMLKPLQDTGSGLTLSSASPSGNLKVAEASASQIRVAWEAVESAPPTVRSVEVTRGALIGLHIRLENFEIFDLTTQARYRGKIAPEAVADASVGLAVGTQEYVRASIRVEAPFATAEGERGTKYFLTSVAALEVE